MKIEEADVITLLGYSEDDLTLCMTSVDLCEHCGDELIGGIESGTCVSRCDLSNSKHKEWLYYSEPRKVRRRKLNKLAKFMEDTKVNWDGVDIIEMYEDFGTYTGVASYLGVSIQSVSRHHKAVSIPDVVLNSFI
jgi:hypothetical protein